MPDDDHKYFFGSHPEMPWKKKQKKPGLRCPECGSKMVEEYMMPVGPRWCFDCGYKVEQKENDTTFLEKTWLKRLIRKIRQIISEKFFANRV